MTASQRTAARVKSPRRSRKRVEKSMVSVEGRRPWKVVNPSGARWSQSFDTPEKAWTRILTAHDMRGLAGARKLLEGRGWKVLPN